MFLNVWAYRSIGQEAIQTMTLSRDQPWQLRHESDTRQRLMKINQGNIPERHHRLLEEAPIRAPLQPVGGTPEGKHHLSPEKGMSPQGHLFNCCKHVTYIIVHIDHCYNMLSI